MHRLSLSLTSSLVCAACLPAVIKVVYLLPLVLAIIAAIAPENLLHIAALLALDLIFRGTEDPVMMTSETRLLPISDI